MPYAPLGRSMLTGTVRGKADLPEGDRRLAHPRFQGEALDKNVELVKRLETIAREKRCTAPQLALAWVLAQGKDIVPIPGTKRRERIDENLTALEVKLSAEDLKRISEAAPPGAGAGTRYPAGRNEARVPLTGSAAARWLALATMWSLQYIFMRMAVPVFGIAAVAEGARPLCRAVPASLGGVGRAPAHRPARALAGLSRDRLVNNVLPFVCFAWAATAAAGRLPRDHQRHWCRCGPRSSPCRC